MNDFPLKKFTEEKKEEKKTIEGEVQFKSVRENGYGIKIENKWYNGFGTTEANTGDRIKIEYTISEKGFNNIETITILDKATIGTTILCPYCNKQISISVK